MSQFEYKQHYQRNLPHRQPPEATLFVTFRLDGSLPAPVLEQWRREKKQLEITLLRWAATAPPETVPDPAAVAAEKLKFQRRWFKKFEQLLDGATTGPCWLRQAEVAAIVAEALRQRDGTVYRLDAYCIMPNHVHTVFAPYLTEPRARELADNAIRRKKEAGYTLLPAASREDEVKFALATIMQSLKGWTARECNRLLNRRGPFWQHESFDHVIRAEAEWERVVNYVVNNPVKAGLVTDWLDWPWSYRRPALDRNQERERR